MGNRTRQRVVFVFTSGSVLWMALVAVGTAGPPDPEVKTPGRKSKSQKSARIEKSDPKTPQARSRGSQSLEEMFLFQPMKHPQGNWKPKGLDFEDVWFQASDGVRLHGWYCPRKNPRAVVLLAHGNAGNVTHRSGVLRKLQRELGLSVLIFDYRGYGRSAGTPTIDGVLRDARAARKFLARREKIGETDVVLFGRSLGGAVVVELAADDGARGLILESTFTSLRDIAAHHSSPLLAQLVPLKQLNSVSKIAAYQGPLLQSHGNADRVVPFAQGRRLFEAANHPKRFVTLRRSDHNDPQTAQYYRALDQFITSFPAIGQANKE
jgi:fermentation-respiration switch protein FrsA (DUF1100 family)